jgi:hypothetical protein
MDWTFILLVLLAIFLCNEIYCLVVGRPTLSAKVRQWSKLDPAIEIMIVFFAGLVAGHWWWQ